jgi:hypothetical protein
MTVIWDEEVWNLLHILAPLMISKEYTLFYDWVTIVADNDHVKLKWLSDHPVQDNTDLATWVNQFHQFAFPAWKPSPVYYTKDRINKDVWGPYLWKWLHRASYRSSDSVWTQRSLEYIIQLLPCPVCRVHSREYVKHHPFTEDMVTWLIEFHNHVSDQLNTEYGTKKKRYTNTEAYALYPELK